MEKMEEKKDMEENKVTKEEDEATKDKKAVTQGFTELFVKLAAIEIALIENKVLTPLQLAEGQVKALAKLQEFITAQNAQVKDES